ncbi:hypothetical protein HGRIS_005341 [Hohenbuehelia grisea]|uniref:Xylanolytic transcriptional activator regulatory domain-containing protein n=1 Tax=Hohenbuehelia grisea TaxID=104357 RepID=A0ABR3JEP5_9AGAR
MGSFADCEYVTTGARPHAAHLEETIAILENRIRELENPGNTAGSVILSSPYRLEPGPGSSATSSSSVAGGRRHHTVYREPRQLNNMDSATSPGTLVRRLTRGNTSYKEEPAPAVKAALLHTFVHHASEIGFFLDAKRFVMVATVSDTQAQESELLPALISAACLWGLRLSRTGVSNSPEGTHQQSVLRQAEEGYLNQALDKLAGMVTSPTISPHVRVLHTIQAEILLANYFFDSGRAQEGRHHTSTAVALALGAGLNRGNGGVAPPTALPPTMDSIETRERIGAFWAVLMLDNLWSAALETPPNLQLRASTGQGVEVDIPWPSEDGVEVELSSRSVITEFLNGTETGNRGRSLTALLIKASILVERAHYLGRRYRPDFNATQRDSFQANQAALGGVMRRFISSIPNPDASTMPDTTLRTLSTIHTISQFAKIKLFSLGRYGEELGSPNSRNIAVETAIMISRTAPATDESNVTFVNPMLGVRICHTYLNLTDELEQAAWTTAASVLLDEATRLRRAGRRTPVVNLAQAVQPLVSSCARLAADATVARLEYIRATLAELTGGVSA